MEWLSELIDFIFGQYRDYSSLELALELIAVGAAIVSVFFSYHNKVLVYPFGLLSTAIFVYLLYQWELPGDLIINAYYFIMSVYGWYNWSSDLGEKAIAVTKVSNNEWLKSAGLFTISAAGVYGVYVGFEMLNGFINYLDIITTGIAFVGMWLMALRKLEHWLVLLAANLISIPLYFIKGYSFTAFLYIFLAVMAYLGYQEWRKQHFKKDLMA